VLDLGSGVQLRVLTVGKRGAILLLEWERFRLLLPQGANFDDLEALKNGAAVGPVTALLLADGGYAPVNPPEWIANLRPKLAFSASLLPTGKSFHRPRRSSFSKLTPSCAPTATVGSS